MAGGSPGPFWRVLSSPGPSWRVLSKVGWSCHSDASSVCQMSGAIPDVLVAIGGESW